MREPAQSDGCADQERLLRRVRWWREDGGTARDGPVNLDALGPKPADADREQESGHRGARRRRVRCRLACAVCARLDWDATRNFVHFWKQAEGRPEQSFISDDLPRAPAWKKAVDDEAGEQGKAEEAAVTSTPRELAAQFFSPARYRQRWSFKRKEPGADGGELFGGIPLRELQASAVRDPGEGGELWLLHRKCFKMVMRRDGVEVADPKQKVPVCNDCYYSLSRRRPQMPKFALANDLWMGKLPRQLSGLSEGAWLLLPLLRPLIRRYSCLPDGATWCHPDEKIKAFVGNVAAYAQQDGGRLLKSLPPKPEDLAERLVIAFVGSEADLKRAYIKDLQVSLEAFREAYDFLRAHNALYERVIWDEDAVKAMSESDGLLGLSRVLESCVRLQEPGESTMRARQAGAADAVVTGEEEAEEKEEEALGEEEGASEDPVEPDGEEERWEYLAGVADADMQLDCDRQVQHIEVGLRRAANTRP